MTAEHKLEGEASVKKAMQYPSITHRSGYAAFAPNPNAHNYDDPNPSFFYGYRPPVNPIKEVIGKDAKQAPTFGHSYGDGHRDSYVQLPYWLNWPFFAFPFNVNEWTARLVAFQTFGLCILIICTRNHIWSWYITAALFADGLCRFFLGSRGSFLGVTAEWVSFFLPRKLVPGPPKQFAALCSVILTGFATLAYFLRNNSEDGAAGSIIIGVLAFCSALECFANFCVGCFCFQIGIQVGAFKNDGIYKSLAIHKETDRTIEETDKRLNKGEPRLHAIYRSPDELPCYFKYSTGAHKREAFHIIKHCRIDYFSIPMSITGLAIAWQIASNTVGIKSSAIIWQILSIVSGSLYGAILCLYILRCILYTRKVIKEWQNPILGNYFTLITLNILLFCPLCVAGDKHKLAEVLFWISGPLNAFITLLTLSKWIIFSQDDRNLNPSYLFPVVSNVVAAAMLPIVHPTSGYPEAALFWWAFSVFAFVIFTTLTLGKLITSPQLPDIMKPSIFVYLAASSVICFAYLQLNGGSWDIIALISFYISVFFALWFLTLGFHGYFGRDLFNVNYWGFIFPLDAFASIVLLYQDDWNSDTTFGIACTVMVILNAVVAIISAHTFLLLLQRRLFVPADKFSPLQMFKIQHFSFREALKKLKDAVPTLLDEPSKSNAALARYSIPKLTLSNIVEFVDDFALSVRVHTDWEELILFPSVREWYPVTEAADHQHEEHVTLISDLNIPLRRIRELVDKENAKATEVQVVQIQSGSEETKSETPHISVDKATETAFPSQSTQAVLQQLVSQLQSAVDHAEKEFIAHLDGEECYFIGRKYFSSAQVRDILRNAYLSVPTHQLERIIPFILNNQFNHSRRVRALHCLRDVIPERIQQVGKFVYEHCNEFLYQRLLVDVPQMAPRSTAGHHRIF